MSKKIIILIVSLECIFAILLVSILGIALESAVDKDLVTNVIFVDENNRPYEDNENIEIDFSSGSRSYQLHWIIENANATNKEVEFYTNKSEDYVKVNSDGKVTFYKLVTVEVTVRAIDGSNKQDSIILIPKQDNDHSVDI